MVDKDRCESCRRPKGIINDYGMSLAISFVPGLKGLTEKGLWLCLSFTVITEVRRQIGPYMENDMSVGNYGMSRMISLYSVNTTVLSCHDRGRVNWVSDYTCPMV